MCCCVFCRGEKERVETKLFEQQNNILEAGNTYMKGIRIAERQQNQHTKKELQEAYNSLMNIDDSEF